MTNKKTIQRLIGKAIIAILLLCVAPTYAQTEKSGYELFFKDYVGQKIEIVTVEDSIYQAKLAGVKKDTLILEMNRTRYERLAIPDVEELRLKHGGTGSVIKNSFALFGIFGIATMFLFAFSGT